MNAVLSPLVSEFETPEKEFAYTAWLEAKIKCARSSAKPLIPHDQVMAQVQDVIASKRKDHTHS